jgi:hypothetical protein
VTPCRECGRPSFGADGFCTDHRKPPVEITFDGCTTQKQAMVQATARTRELRFPAAPAHNITARILSNVRARPSTCEELALILDLTEKTTATRLAYLRTRGHIEDSGETKQTARGQTAIIWRGTPTKTDELRG